MIRHIVLLSFKDGMCESDIASVIQSVVDLQQSIPEMKDIVHGVDASVEGLAQGFTHSFVILFENEQARDAYLYHPEHVRVADEVVRPTLKSILVFDLMQT